MCPRIASACCTELGISTLWHLSTDPALSYRADTLTKGAAEYAVLTEKLATYISSAQGGSGALTTYPSATNSVAQMLALSLYDVSKDSNTPDLEVIVRSNSTTLLSAEFRSASDAVVRTTTPWSDLDNPPAPLEFSATGSGAPSLLPSAC